MHALALALFGAIVLVPIGWLLVPTVGELPRLLPLLVEGHSLSLGANTLLIAIVSAALATLLGFPLAFLLERTDLPARRVLWALSLLPLLIPPYVHGLVWNTLGARLGLGLHGPLGCGLVLGLNLFPLSLLVVQGGLRCLDPSLEEAALLCRRPLGVLRGVVWPLVRPQVLAGATLVFVLSSLEYGVPAILGVRVYPVEVFVQFSAFYDESAAAFLCLPLTLLAFGLLLAQRRALAGSLAALGRGGPTYDLGGLRPAALAFCTAILIPSAAVPLGALLFRARAPELAVGPLALSLGLALGSAALAVGVGLPLAHAAQRRGWLEVLVLLPLAVPPTALGIGLIRTWGRLGLGMALPLVGHLGRVLPFVVLVVAYGLRRVNPRLEEAALLSTGSWARIIWRVLAPCCRPFLAGAVLMAAVLSLGELGVSLLTVPPGFETIPLRAYNLLHYGAAGQVAALCLISVGMALGLSLLVVEASRC